MRNTIFIALISIIFFISCDKEDSDISKKEDNKAKGRITIEKADSLITDWVFGYRPGMNPSFAFDSIVEYTTDDIYSKFSGQIFSARSEVPGMTNRWFFIKNDTVYDLHGYHYYEDGTLLEQRADSENLLITDLDNDSNYELTYIGNWGSGCMRQTLNSFYLSDENSFTAICKDIAIVIGPYDFYIRLEGYQNLYLQYYDDNYDVFDIGTIKIVEQDGEKKFVIELYDDCPQEIKDKVLI